MAQAKHVITAILAPVTGAASKSSSDTIRLAHARFVSALVGHPPRPIPLIPRPADLEERADHARKVLDAFSDYLISLMDDTAEDVAGGLEIQYIKAALSDLSSDVVGIIQGAAND